MSNVLLFAFMTFWIWGWILLWPISKVKDNSTKGWVTTVAAVPFLASVVFNYFVFFESGGISATVMGQTGIIFFGLESLTVWIPVFLALVTFPILSAIFGWKGSKVNDWFDEFGSFFVVTFILFIIYFFLGEAIVWFFVSYITPLISILL